MKFLVVGAGAVGVYFAGCLSNSGHDVTIVARGRKAAAIRDHGLSLETTAGRLTARPAVVEPGMQPERPDFILLCVKAYAVADALRGIIHLTEHDAPVVFVQNGIPWWYFSAIGQGRNPMDPDGWIDAVVPADRVVGCVTYANVRNVDLGAVAQSGGNRTILGRPIGPVDAVVEALCVELTKAGIDALPTDQIPREVWLKLWGNLAFNPISALTGATMDRIIEDAATRPIVIAMMREGAEVAAACGVDMGMTIEERLAIAAQAGAFRTSMLQDLDAGRRLEFEAIVGAVSALGRELGVPTPTVDTVFGLIRQKAAGLGML